jgi:DnaJ-domain-containing protein 1
MKTCALCTKPIIGRGANATHCSTKCQRDHMKMRQTHAYQQKRSLVVYAARECNNPLCDQTFTPKHAGKRYCSAACRRALNRTKDAPNARKRKLRKAMQRHGWTGQAMIEQER